MSDTNLYEQQINQIQIALQTCDNEEDRANLISLKNDLEELISLESEENENLEEENNYEENKKKVLFQHLINEKCRAPFNTRGQSGESYHNAFIADVLPDDESDEDVTVKVFFLNPIQDSMRACDYYFTDNCTFDENCKYSHGENLKYSRLKQYQKPNYKLLKKKSHVLVKTDSLWKPASVTECSQALKTCQVKLHNSGKTFDCPFSDILPPIETNSDSSDLSTDEEYDNESLPLRNVFQIDDNFGEWEKYTTGIGSKILQKYGYQSGEGLGKRKDGITQPISAKIYVQGKSLDYNMNLNERKGQMTVEKKLKRQSLKQQKIREKNYSSNENEIFNFLNNTICNINPSSSSATSSKSESVKNQTKAQLNLRIFKIEEDIKKVELSLKKLKESVQRHSKDSSVLKNIQRQVDDQQKSLETLQRTLSEVNDEQKSRKEKSKLSIF